MMDSAKLKLMAGRLFGYEIDAFLIGVASGQIAPVSESPEWHELKQKVQCSKTSEDEVRAMAELCGYERLMIVYELLDELEQI